jgi:hypothetical protein
MRTLTGEAEVVSFTSQNWDERISSVIQNRWSDHPRGFACYTPNLTFSYFAVGRHAEQHVDNPNKHDSFSVVWLVTQKMCWQRGWQLRFTESLGNGNKCENVFILPMMKIMVVLVYHSASYPYLLNATAER